MPDDGAQPARTTAIRLESLKDHVAPQTAERHQLIVVDGHGQETGSWLAESQQTAELQVLCPQNDESREQAELIN